LVALPVRPLIFGVMSLEESMLQRIARGIPIVGVLIAVSLLSVSAYMYAGDVHWSRVTVSMLCAQNLPDGNPNLGRLFPMTGLLLLCSSMALLFHFLSGVAETRAQHDLIQIGGIGSQVYSLLTATPLHNLMWNIALVFYLVAIVTIVYMVYRKQTYVLAIAGTACLVLTLFNVSLYYTNRYAEVWGVLQKLTFILTTLWLFAVHLTVKRKPIAT
jgi:hypothetical protein